jgi:hypothetical protein
MNAATAGLIGTAIGSLSSGAVAIIILLINKRSEERRQMRELGMKAAIDNWRSHFEDFKQKGGSLPPVEVYIVHMVKLFEMLGSKNLTADNLAAKLREVVRFSDIANAEAEQWTEKLAAKASGKSAPP